MSGINVLKVYNKAATVPFGKKLFSLVFSLWAPYFRTIGAEVVDLKKGHASVFMKQSWYVYVLYVCLLRPFTLILL